jgi:hypothetical protein
MRDLTMLRTATAFLLTIASQDALSARNAQSRPRLPARFGDVLAVVKKSTPIPALLPGTIPSSPRV